MCSTEMRADRYERLRRASSDQDSRSVLSTTQILHAGLLRRLKAVHSHPSAKIDRPTSPATTNGVKSDEGAVPIAPLAAHEPRRDAAEPVATLAIEDEEG
jgi:hypothetical protein